MHLRSLYLKQFRQYREDYFEFIPSLNVISGPNAYGKTTLLEAIHYLMLGRSFRSSRHQEVMLFGTTSFYLEALFCKHAVDQKLRLYFDGKERKILYNSTPLPSASNLLGLIPGVIMTPDDVSLVKGSPPLRRQFLDIQIAQVDPLYVYYLTRYSKAMRHRNQLLKQRKLTSIETWENEMALASSYIVLQRKRLVEDLQAPCRKFYSFLSGEKAELNLEYRSGASQCKDENEIIKFYLEQFKKNRDREMTLGLTLSGPHKDDLWIGIGERDVRYFASEGEQRSCVAALHMGEWERLKNGGDVTPLFMIDDVGISLDNKRRGKLLERLASLGQVFITTTDCHLFDSYEGSKKIISLPANSLRT
jgi:DNA replication and repair protein RecF